MRLNELLTRLDGVKRTGRGYVARCPSHEDRSPSLSIGEGTDGTILIKCFAGCGLTDITGALGLKPRDLFPPRGNGQARQAWTAADADLALERRGIRRSTVEKFGISADIGRQAWRIPVGSGFKMKRFATDGRGPKYWWDGGKPKQGAELYGLDQLPCGVVHVWLVEGEPDVWIAWQAGLAAVSFTGGAETVPRDALAALAKAGIAAVTICYDRDDAGEAGARTAASMLAAEGIETEVRSLPHNLPPGSDITDLYNHLGRDDDTFCATLASADVVPPDEQAVARPERQLYEVDDFSAYMPEHRYIYHPTRMLWPAASVNAGVRLQRDLDEHGQPRSEDGRPLLIPATKWLDRHRSVEQMTWSPGDPLIIRDRLIDQGGWVSREGASVFNLYRAPTIEPGDPEAAGPWLEHIRKLFPEECDHIVLWLAHRVQRPDQKVNHALVLQGGQGTGKDTIIQGVLPAVGTWNCAEVSPHQLMGRFNGFLKCVILRVSEARDLGDTNRYHFYESMKTYVAAPPTALRVDEKNVREYMIPNVCGVVLTSNHVDGLYLPPDDRRHFVASTDKTKEGFSEGYWQALYGWYETGDGYRHVAAYLGSLDIAGFNPTAPPPKTRGFWQVVDAGRSPEDAEMADALDALDWPPAVTLDMIAAHADEDFAVWLRDRRNRRQIPHRMASAGYVPLRNEGAKDGNWKVGRRRRRIYTRQELPIRDQHAAATSLMRGGR